MKQLLLPTLCVLFLQSFVLSLCAQSSTDWQEVLRDWMTVEDVDETYGEETMELLEDLADTKLNINQVTREQLEQLPFLSAQQVEDIMLYLHRYGVMRTLSELQMIPSIDRDTRLLLACFVEAGPQLERTSHLNLETVRKYGKQTLMLTAKVPAYQRHGDRNGYVGYPYRHTLRYQFAYSDRVKFGLTGAQDAGEPFFANCNRLGYDHYSYYFQLRKMGRFEELNLGMYRVQMGMGLVMNMGFSLGKLMTLQSLGRSSHTLTAHSSRSEDSYLQGAAATVRLSPHWKASAFASFRPCDATLNDDGSVRTLLTTAYHRTPTEIAKRHNTHAADFGTRFSYQVPMRNAMAFINANLVYTRFDRPLHPQKQAVYKQYAQEGNNFLNASIDYSYTNSRLSFSGETALNADAALAALHVLSFRLSEQWSLMALHRYYDKRYTALRAHSFSEGSSVQNEHGVYLGATWTPLRAFLLQAYADYVHFPWPRYLVSAPSDAFDFLARARVLYNRWSVEGRYRFHLRQRDNAEHTLLQNRPEHRARLRATLLPMTTLTLATQADAVTVTSHGERSQGLMLSEQAVWKLRRLQFAANVAWFHTDDYDSRLYQYERSVLHEYSMPMYYGHGIRYALMARADIGHFMTIVKIGTTNYFDRAVISTGLQQIDASSVTDFLFQLRYRF